MKKLLLLLFIIIYGCNKKNNFNLNDDLLPNNFKKLSVKQRQQVLDNLFLKIIENKNDSSKVNALLKLSNEYYYLREFSSSIKVSNEIIKISKSINDTLNLGKSYYYIGDCYLDFHKDSAYYYYKESEKIFKIIKNDDRLAKVYYNKAYLLYYEGNYVESEIEVIKAINILESSKKLTRLYRCYSLQGSNHLELGEYDKAIEYFDLSALVLKDMVKKNQEKDAFYDYEIANTVDICNAYDKKGEYTKSIDLLKEVITTKN